MNKLDRKISLKQLFIGFAESRFACEHVVQGLVLDSREVEPGFVYFAMSGMKFHGLDFIDEVLSKKASAIVVESGDKYLSYKLRERINHSECHLIEVEDLAEKVGLIAARYYQNEKNDLTIIGITGTDGKTSVAQLTATALQSCGYESGVMGTNGWGRLGKLQSSSLTTPNPIEVHRQLSELRSSGAQYVTMEVSSHALEQGRVQGVRFRVAVFTNIARDHLDYHGTAEKYAEAKKKLFYSPGLSAAVINADDNLGAQLISSLKNKVRLYDYSVSKPSKFRGCDIRTTRDGLFFNIKNDSKIIELRSALLGAFNIYNLLAVYAVLSELGLKEKEIVAAIENLKSVAGRIEKFSVTGYPLVVVDFAHTPQALEAVLTSLRSIKCDKIWCVFGCGGDRDKGKRSLMGEIASRYSDEIIITNDNPRTENPECIASEIYNGARKPTSIKIILDRKMAIETAIAKAAVDDCILIAGKGHEEFQIMGTECQPFNDKETVLNAMRLIAS